MEQIATLKIDELKTYVLTLIVAFAAAGATMYAFVDREARRPEELRAELLQQKEFIETLKSAIPLLKQYTEKVGRGIDRIDAILPPIVVSGSPTQLLPDYVIDSRTELSSMQGSVAALEVTTENLELLLMNSKQGQFQKRSSFSLITTALGAPVDATREQQSNEQRKVLKELFEPPPAPPKEKTVFPKDTPPILYTLLFIPLVFAVGGFYMAAFSTKKNIQAFGLDCIKTLIGFYSGAAGTFLAMLAK